MATISGDFVFTDEEAKIAAETLKDAMDGLGTNEDAIVKVLVNHNNEQRQTIAETYAAAYGKPLLDDLVSELGGDLEETVVALMHKPREYDAKMLHDAVSGVGTDEKTIIAIMCTRSNDEIEEIKEIYKEKYDADLVEDLNSDLGGYFGRMVFSMASGARQECDADHVLADEEAQKLVDAGIGQFGTDECDFNSVLCLSSPDQLRVVFDKYREKTGSELEDHIDCEMSGDLKEGYLTIVKVTKNKHRYLAERLNKAMRGWGTDDSELIRLIVSRCEEDLKWVAEAYEDMYETRLYDDVAGECSSHYKRLLLSLINGSYVGPDE